MHITFTGDTQQNRWAQTQSLKSLQQQEIVTPAPWPSDDPRDRFIESVLQFIEHYISSQPKRITSEQTLRYGWTTFRFVKHKDKDTETLLLTELQHPFSDSEPTFVPGLANTYRLMQLQNAAMRRNRVSGDVEYPHRSQSAIICNRITSDTIVSSYPIMAHRAWQPEARTSGWFIGCTDQGHDHQNPKNLTNVHLLHLLQSLPALFPYLPLPVEYMLLLESTQTIVFHPGQQEGQIDSASPLTNLF